MKNILMYLNGVFSLLNFYHALHSPNPQATIFGFVAGIGFVATIHSFVEDHLKDRFNKEMQKEIDHLTKEAERDFEKRVIEKVKSSQPTREGVN